MNPHLTAAGVSLITNFITRGDLGPGKTLTDIWDVVLGNYFHALNEKSKAKYQLKIDDFKQKLGEKILNIPKENVQDPQLSIVGQALEASKYHFDEEEIREMFANLIASSMDSTYNGLVQHSFVEIIKQLSPHDAKLFKSLEMTSILFMHGNDYSFSSTDFPHFELNTLSLNNLKRLGLIDIIYNYAINDSKEANTWERLIHPSRKLFDRPKEIFCHITRFGTAFKKVCIKDSL